MFVLIGCLLVQGVLLSHAISEPPERQPACKVCDCSPGTTVVSVDCSKKNLSYVPSDIPLSTETLNMSGNYLEFLPDAAFQNLTSLKVLDLSSTFLSINNVTNLTFSGLTNLIELNISHNDELPLTNDTLLDNLFGPLTSLEVLRMYGTTAVDSSGYPDQHLAQLKHLKSLWMDGMTNKIFGASFKSMTNLRQLRLSGDLIQPPWRSQEFCKTNLSKGMLDNLVSVTSLTIRKCFLQRIDATAFQHMTEMTYLDLSDNNFLTLKGASVSFGSLPNNLTVLVLNELESGRSPDSPGVVITEEMITCLQYTSLRELYLDQNRIQSVHSEVFKLLPFLETLTVNSNGFYLGFYVFSVRDLCNVRRLEMAFQFFSHDVSIWHKSSGDPRISDRQKDSINENAECLNKRKVDKPTECNDVYSDFTSEISQVAETVLIENDQKRDRRPTDSSFTHTVSIPNRTATIETSEAVESGDNVDRNDSIWHVDHGALKINDRQYTRVSSFGNIPGVYTGTCPRPQGVQMIPPGVVTAYLPKNLKYLDLSHSLHGVPVYHFELDENNTIEILNASHSLLYCWEGPVRGLTRLKELDLSSNLCKNVSLNFFRYASSLEKLNVQHNFLGYAIENDTNGEILQNLTRLKHLNLADNYIEEIPGSFFKFLKSLRTLDLSENMIETFNVTLVQMVGLTSINLQKNKLNNLSEEMQQELGTIAVSTGRTVELTVDLTNNPIHCYCNNQNFLKWALKHSNKNGSLRVIISKCYDTDQKMVNLTGSGLQQVISDLEKECASYLELIISTTLLAVVCVNIIIGVIVHRFRWRIQYWWYVGSKISCWNKTMTRDNYEPIEERYKYHVCVLSSDDEESKAFVIDKLRSEFRKANLASYINVYHINFNENYTSRIGQAINQSRVVLFVLSEGWSSDEGMKTGLHMWQCDMDKRQKHSVFAIRLRELVGNDALSVKELFSDILMDYPADADENVREAFWQECLHNIEELQTH